MSITSSLADFSFPEILQFIETGRKTGLLTLTNLPKSQAVPPIFYIWIEWGRLMAAANCLDHQGLVKLIEQRQWVSERVFDKMVHWCRPLNEPLGLYLKNQGVLRPEHLKQLFNVQVLQPVNALFHLKEGKFQFDQDVYTPRREMTGLSVSAGALKLFTLPEDAKALRPELRKSSVPEYSHLGYQNRINTELIG
ncbi:MAG TPA: DUF4388 domain-containing protein [Candidatus Sericytochromatia bacterium]|jgi:hypothetical protein